jgi:hypothetical protein
VGRLLSCYPDKQLTAQGFVANVRRPVNVSNGFLYFTQTNFERERERARHSSRRIMPKSLVSKKSGAEGEAVKRDLYALFGDSHANRRGKALEGVLNRFFEMSGLLIKEAFTVVGEGGQGALEQIDGAIQCQGDI